MERRKRIFRLATWFMAGFVLLYLFRLAYGYTDPNMKGYEENEYISDYLNSLESVKKNYASSKWNRARTADFEKGGSGGGQQQQQMGGEQKFEKIASLKSKSDKFEPDEKLIRGQVKKFNALVQYEHNEGNPGSRSLHLSIGVPPDAFDPFLAEMKKVGKLKSIEVTKTDKTNEYRNLKAQRASLEKTLATLAELKSKPGKIDEYMTLTNRILEIEEQLQSLGVSLGDFDSENEFCTVQMTLAEGRFVSISLMHRLKVALEWTINYYCLFMLIVFFASVSGFCIAWVFDKIRNRRKF